MRTPHLGSLGSPGQACIPAFHPQLLQRRRRPPAPGRAPGRQGLISSYQVRPVTCYSGWGRTDSAGTPFPQNKLQAPERGSVLVERGSWAWDLAGLRSPPPSSCFPRPRSSERWPWTWGQEAVSRGVSHQPRLQEVPPPPPVPPVPSVQCGPRPPLHTPQRHPLFSPSKKPAGGVDFDDP